MNPRFSFPDVCTRTMMFATPVCTHCNTCGSTLAKSMGASIESQGAFGPTFHLSQQQNVMRGSSYGCPMVASPTRSAAFTEGKLFLGGLNCATTKESLMNYCRRWSEDDDVIDAVVMDGRGFGFITFVDPRKAQKFLEQRCHRIDGKNVEAKAAVPKGVGSGNNLTKKLFVGGTGDLSDEDFRSYFESFGEVQDSLVVRKPDGASRGFGFISFTSEMTVEKCLVIQHEIKGRKVDLRRAVPRDQMASTQAVCLATSRPNLGPVVGGYGGMGYGDVSAFGYNMGTNYQVGAMPPYYTNYGPY